MENKEVTGIVVNVIRRRDNSGDFLFLLRSGGRFKGEWWPVAGTCESNELPINTVVRELIEETGLSPIELYSLGKEVEHIDRTSKLEGFVAFVDPDAEVKLNYEHSEYKWLTVQEALEIVSVPIRPYIQYVDENFIKQVPESERLI